MSTNERIAFALLDEAAMLETEYGGRLRQTCDLMEQAAAALKNTSAVWQYHNDEHGTWWGCSKCGKVCRKNPHEKRFCSRCGRVMTLES